MAADMEVVVMVVGTMVAGTPETVIAVVVVGMAPVVAMAGAVTAERANMMAYTVEKMVVAAVAAVWIAMAVVMAAAATQEAAAARGMKGPSLQRNLQTRSCDLCPSLQ